MKDINLLNFTSLNSLISFIKAFKDEFNSRRKVNPRIKIILYELNNYINIEIKWLNTLLSRYHKINQYVNTYNKLIISVEAFNTEID